MDPLSGYPQLARAVSGRLAALRADTPAPMKGFADLSRAALAEGALSAKTKELMALALGVAAHCSACIAFHAKTLVGLGATQREIEETLAVAVYMGGGPSLMYGAEALAAFAEFAAAAPPAQAAPTAPKA